MLQRLAALAALLLVPAGTARAAEPVLPLDQVRPGSLCTAASVVRGTAISTFAARVDDVIPPTRGDLRTARLLLTLSGPAVDATGVGPGFSGSPVICAGPDGVARVAGAISESIGAYGGLTVLATPIEAVIAEPADPPRARASAPRTATQARLLRSARRLAEPLTVTGLSPALGRAFRAVARRAGRTVFLAPAAAPVASAPPFQPGSAMSAGIATGDVEVGAIGTVAYVDGDRVWAAGHPLDGVGRRGLFLAPAYVFTVVSNPNATQEAGTYKLATSLPPTGTLLQDGLAGIVGRVGSAPPAFPISIATADRDTGRRRALNVRVADERGLGFPTGVSALTTIAPAAIAQAIAGALGGSPVRQSAEMCLRITVRERRAPLGFCNRYVGGGGAPDALLGGPVVADALAATQFLDAYDASPLTITNVEVGLRVWRGLRLATLTSARGPAVARRGSRITVRLRLRRPGGGRLARTVRVAVPRRMPAGARELLLRGTEADVSAAGGGEDEATIDLSELFASEDGPAPPGSVSKLAAELDALERWDGVRGRFLPPGADVPEELPGGAERVAQRARRVLRDRALRIDGSVRVPLRVR